jgi:hypothetical protein
VLDDLHLKATGNVHPRAPPDQGQTITAAG